MLNKTNFVILVIIAMMAAGCGKIRTCYCLDNSYYDIIDTALHDSIPYPVYDNSLPYEMESAMECSFWETRDTIGQYLPEYGIQMYFSFECHEK
jgi:hypothetical protein